MFKWIIGIFGAVGLSICLAGAWACICDFIDGVKEIIWEGA